MSVRLRPLCCLVVVALAACQPNRDGTGTVGGSAGEANQASPLQPQPPQNGQNGPGGQANTPGGGNGGGNQAMGGGNGPAPQQPNGALPPNTAPQVTSPNFRTLGRVVDGQTLSWPGTGIEARFTGTRGSATFAVVSGTNYVAVAVDDGAPTRVQVQQNVPVAFGPVAQGSHRVRITKLNEAELGILRLTALRADGALSAAPSPNRLIEFVGDSISLGYGVEGTRPCDNSSAMENVQKAWSGLTGSALGADVSVIAWSGHGMLRNALGVADPATMPQLYLRGSANDAAAKYNFAGAAKPQAVVVALGTNDFTYDSDTAPRAMLDQDAFVATYLSFVKLVRANYPAATLVLAGSPMLSDSYPTSAEAQHTSLLRAITAVQTQMNDANVRVLDLPTMNTTITACDYHPSAAEQVTMSGLLVTELRAALGW